MSGLLIVLDHYSAEIWGVAAGGVLFWVIAMVQAWRRPPTCFYCKRNINP
jgi:hypothetical protein